MKVFTAHRKIVTIEGWTEETLLAAFPWFVKSADGVWLSSADIKTYAKRGTVFNRDGKPVTVSIPKS